MNLSDFFPEWRILIGDRYTSWRELFLIYYRAEASTP